MHTEWHLLKNSCTERYCACRTCWENITFALFPFSPPSFQSFFSTSLLMKRESNKWTVSPQFMHLMKCNEQSTRVLDSFYMSYCCLCVAQRNIVGAFMNQGLISPFTHRSMSTTEGTETFSSSIYSLKVLSECLLHGWQFQYRIFGNAYPNLFCKCEFPFTSGSAD